jgi:hypothetical protein
MVDRPKPPDVPKPAVPAPPDATKMSHTDWQTKHERNMPQRPEKGSADTQGKRGDRPSDVQKPTDATAPQRRPDAKAGTLWTLPRPKDGKVEIKTVIDRIDVAQYRTKPGGPVDMQRLKTDIAKEIKHQAEQRKGPGGVLVDVRMRNVQFGKGSEAAAIRLNLVDIGHKDKIVVRFTVQDASGRVRNVEGMPLGRPALPKQPVIVPDPPGGGPGKPGPAPGPRRTEKPGVPQQPPAVPPPHVVPPTRVPPPYVPPPHGYGR